MVTKAVILAGGLATRLQAYYPDTVKSLIEFDNKPFIYYQLKLLRENGFSNVVICAGYGADKIENYVNHNNFGMNIRISRDGEEPLGTGGAIKNAIPMLGYDFLVIYGDSYLNFDYREARYKFYNSCKLGLMTIYHNKNKLDKSNIEYNKGVILSYDKENPSLNAEYIDYGASFFKCTAFHYMPRIFDLSELQKKLIDAKQMETLEIKDRFYEIGSIKGIKSFKKMLKEKNVLNGLSG